MKKNRLPVAKYENGKWMLSEPYDFDNRIVCTPYGEMSDGTMVWESENGKQYTKQKFFGKYYFCEM